MSDTTLIPVVRVRPFAARRFALIAAMVVTGLFLSAPARAAEGELFQLPVMTEATWAELEQRAAAMGTLPVIVALKIDVLPEHALAAAERAAQRASIARTRAAALADIGGAAVRRRSDEMPLVSLAVDVRDLARLRASRHVAAVTEDREVELDPGFQPGERDTTAPVRPPAERVALGGGTGIAGTSNNGDPRGSQLPAWWDWYRIGVDRARSQAYTGSGQLVAVIDTGVDRYHGWLLKKVVNEACFASVSTYALALGSAGSCPNGRNEQLGLGAAAPCSYSYSCAHGTHVAHTAAGTWGVASGASIMAINVFHRGSNGEPTYFESDVVWALKHVYDNRANYRIAAVNMSIGGATAAGLLYAGYCDYGPASDGTTNATYLAGWIDALKSVGIATVVASGNDNSSTGLRRPGCIANAISVGNTTLDPVGSDAVFGNTKFGSNSNSTLDLLAPGTDICSAVPSSLDDDGYVDGVDCSYVGTSMAAPHVAGAIAVLRAYRSTASVDALHRALVSSGPSIYDSRNGVSRTRINVWNALFNI